MRKLLLLALCAVFLTGCFSDDSDTQTKKPKGPQYKSGLSAFSGLFATARMWREDAAPIKLQSQDAQGLPTKDGKAVVWRAVFASASKGSMRAYTWSGTDSDGAPPPGVSPGGEDTYNPANVSTKIFQVGAVQTDSEKAFEIAQAHGGKALLAKTPDTPVRFELATDQNGGELAWFVSYGPNPNAPTLRVAIDCASGNFLRIVK